MKFEKNLEKTVLHIDNVTFDKVGEKMESIVEQRVKKAVDKKLKKIKDESKEFIKKSISKAYVEVSAIRGKNLSMAIEEIIYGYDDKNEEARAEAIDEAINRTSANANDQVNKRIAKIYAKAIDTNNKAFAKTLTKVILEKDEEIKKLKEQLNKK